MTQNGWPLSGDVTQAWRWWMNQSFGQFGLINIEQTVSSDPALERRIVTEVAGYGKQLGRVTGAMLAVLEHSKDVPFTAAEQKAIGKFQRMAEAIEDEKRQYGASAEEMLDRVIDEAKKNKNSSSGKRLVERMRKTVEELSSGTKTQDENPSLSTEFAD